jgi:WD40 repeat protein
MNNDEDDKKIVQSRRRDITVFDSSLAKRGLELITKPSLKDIIHFSNKISAENASQVSKIAQFGEGRLSQILWSSDDSLLIMASLSGIYVYNAKDLRRVRVVDDPAVSISISADGNVLAATVPEGEIHLWQVKDWTLLRKIRPPGNTIREPALSLVTSMALSLDGTLVAAKSGDDNEVTIWGVEDGLIKKSFRRDSKDNHSWAWSDGEHTLAFSPDGSLLAASSSNGIYWYRVEDGSVIRTPDITNMDAIVFSPDGKTLAGRDAHNTINIVRVSDGSIVLGIKSSSCLAFSPNGEFLATYDLPNILIRRVSDGKSMVTLKGHPGGEVKSLSFASNGKHLASGSEDGSIYIRNITNRFKQIKLDGKVTPFMSMDISPDSNYIATGLSNCSVCIWRISNGSIFKVFTGHKSSVDTIAFHPNGDELASGSHDGSIHLWRISEGRLIRTFGTEKDKITCLAFSPDVRQTSGLGN